MNEQGFPHQRERRNQVPARHPEDEVQRERERAQVDRADEAPLL